MKKRLLQLLFLLVLTGAYGQVGIGTSMPDNSSQLDIVAENRGILIPRLKLTSTTDILTISKGNVNSLLVFNTATTADVKPGYYYWFEDRWNRISIASDLGSSQSNVIFNPAINDFSYINNAGNIQVINFENLVKTNETITVLVNNNNGTYTYNNEAGTPVIIDANTTKVSVVDGVYTFIDAAGNTITSMDTNASASTFDNKASGLTASNVQSAIDELATTIATNKGDLTVAGGLEFTGGTNGIAKLLADTGIQVAIGGIGSTQLANNAITSDKILDGTIATADLATGAVSADKLSADGALAGKVATVNADGTVSYQDISVTNIVDKKGVTTDGIIKVNGTNALAKSVLLDAALSIADGGISSTQLANNAVTTDKIADGAVTNTKLGADAITSDKILDGTIATADLAAGAVSADKLSADGALAGKVATVNADGTVSYQDISVTNIVDKKGVTTDGIIKVNGTNALAKSVLLDAALSIADGGISSTQLANNAVTTDKIADGAVTNAKVGADAITSDKILDGTIATADLANKAVTADKLGSGAATLGQIATANGDGTVTYKDIAITDANITSTKGVTTDGIIKVNGINALAKSVLLDAALSIADGGITTDKIADGAVTNAKVGAGAITSDKILDGTIATADLANKAVTADKLGSGAATLGQIATANGDGTVTYKDIAITDANITSIKGVTTDGIIKVNGTNALAKSVLLDAALSIADGGISSTQLATNAVTTNKIADGAVTNAKVGADAITSDKILDGTIATADLANKAVTADKLGSGAATLGQVATANGDGTVTYKDIAITDANITSTKGVTTDGIIKVNGTNALAKSVLLDAALSIADGGISSTQLATNAVTTDKIADGAVTNAKVGADAITSNKILDGTIATADLANKAVTADKLGSGAATLGQVATANGDGTVTYKTISTTNLADKGSLTVAGGLEFTGGTDGVAKLLANAGIQVAAGGITATQLANNAVTTNKIAPAGNNQVLTTDNTGAPIWVNQATITVTAKNGLHKDGLDIKLGGPLSEVTAIGTDVTNTLAITGLDNQKVQNTTAGAKDYLMAVNDAGVVRALKAAMPKFFYMPSIVMPTAADQITDATIVSVTAGTFTVQLYGSYTKQFGMTVAASSKANATRTTALPVLPVTELDYYVTWYDNTVFDNVNITDSGVLTYTIKPTAEVTIGSFMNIVFAVKP